MALQAVIFDMDGTLVDSMPFHRESWKVFLAQQGMTIDDETFARVNHGTLYDIMPRLFGESTTREESYRLGMIKEQIFRDLYRLHITALPGLREWLQTLSDAGMPAGLATAADDTNADFTLDALQLREYFRAVVTSDMEPAGKPSPAVYLRTAAALGVNPANCLVFEDTVSGVQAARAAGMQVVALTTMHPLPFWSDMPVIRAIQDYHGLRLDEFRQLFASQHT